MLRLNGYAIHISNPLPVYNRVVMYKKHRKKRNYQPRVKVFSHYSEMIPYGQIIKDEINHAIYMNQGTFDKLKEAS